MIVFSDQFWSVYVRTTKAFDEHTRLDGRLKAIIEEIQAKDSTLR